MFYIYNAISVKLKCFTYPESLIIMIYFMYIKNIQYSIEYHDLCKSYGNLSEKEDVSALRFLS